MSRWAPVDLMGQRFGMLTVVGFGSKRSFHRGENLWDVLCDCGTQKAVRSNALRTGKARSCGCQKGKGGGRTGMDLTGAKSQLLTYICDIEPYLTGKQRTRRIECVCACGNLSKGFANDFIRGTWKSCGCLGKLMAAQTMKRLRASQITSTGHRTGTCQIEDLKGQRFGRYTVLELASTPGMRTRWKCQCDCGEVRGVYKADLKRGTARSCGCLARELTRERHAARKSV